MEFQPKPGNKVVIRRKDPFKSVTPASGIVSEAPSNIVARLLTRPKMSETGSPPSGQGACGGTRTRDRRVPADLKADSLSTVPSTASGLGLSSRHIAA
ncbi:hypothetical protein PoB_002718100 [Plakobranchus ocellatus]|uniref:Uncharacterized protein n=1 Tax=Plakobranchus ocellatus TaxID=259542 RepID=A0AAV4A1S4_9GAST|nr:hypothetical protein PoB_002718100 [Plakobranchus ocellatus]